MNASQVFEHAVAHQKFKNGFTYQRTLRPTTTVQLHPNTNLALAWLSSKNPKSTMIYHGNDVKTSLE
jgi:hypothetical protein